MTSGPPGPDVETADCVPLITLAVTPAELHSLLEGVVRDGGRDCTHGLPAGLTEREYEVIAMIGQGRSNLQIADELFLRINSVKTHIRAAYRSSG